MLRFACWTIAVCLGAGMGLANTLYVTSTADDGSTGTLRSVIAAANAGDTIQFQLTFPATIQLTNQTTSFPLITIDKSLTIQGPGPSQLTVSGYSDRNGSYDVFNINQPYTPVANISVSISGMTIEKGGAAVWSSGYSAGTGYTVQVSLDNVALLNNFDGIDVDYGVTATISQCTISGNYLGVSSYSDASDPASNTTITQSTLSGNFGGVYNSYSTVTLLNSTLAGNGFSSGTTGFYAGLIGDQNSTTNVVFTTIVGAPGNATPGVFTYGAGAAFHFKNSLIADNPGGNCSLTYLATVSAGYNLDSDGTCSFTGTGDLTVAPLLDPAGLASNGGPTQTIALEAGSPAIDHVPDASCTDLTGAAVTEDQRGDPRPSGAACDTGAYEYSEGIPIAAKLELSGSSPTSTSFTLTATFNTSMTIDPTQAVSLTIGSYQVTIPAGSFKMLKNGAKAGDWVYSGVIDGVTLSVQIVPPANGGGYQFKANGGVVDVGTATPIPVVITIGSFTGQGSV
jgi:hypothetical protein